MTTKQRFRNGKYRIEVREKDHAPMHIHLTGGGLDVVIDLEAMTAIKGHWPVLLRNEVLAWVSEHRDELIEEWKKWHP